MSDIVILDLGYGNTRSVALAFERLGVTVTLSRDATAVAQADRIVVPGVGAAGVAMDRLRETAMDDVLRRRERPALGICLGMQLLFERSDEDGGTPLLGILPGEVQAITPAAGFPVPHMGWSSIESVEGTGLDTGDYVYFAHSFACPDSDATVSSARYGGKTIPAVIRRGAWWGAQFHPERSSVAGSRFLNAFLSA